MIEDIDWNQYNTTWVETIRKEEVVVEAGVEETPGLSQATQMLIEREDSALLLEPTCLPTTRKDQPTMQELLWKR